MRLVTISTLILIAIFSCIGQTGAQTPGWIYTWDGTDDTHEWTSGWPVNPAFAGATFSNAVAGQLTVTETGINDPPSGIELHGVPLLIHDSFNRVRETSSASGGLDLTGLSSVEMDISHNGSGNINVQMYLQLGFDANIYYQPGLPDVSVSPNTPITLQMPLSGLTDAQRAYIRGVGFQTRDHAALGDVTWTVSEVRSLGTPLTVRDLATHDTGTSDGGLQGAFANFQLPAIVGNNGGQNQTGLSHNPAGTGSLRWTDRGGTGDNSGAAISWINGTEFFNDNSFYERPADLSNYKRLTFRMSATDVVPGGGGSVGVQFFFQTAESGWIYQVPGTHSLPVDGMFHDLSVPLASIIDLDVIQTFGVNLATHPNNVNIDVDLVRFDEGLPGDYNFDSKVDSGDYVVWRKALNTSVPLPNDGTPRVVNDADYGVWVQNYGETYSGSGGSSSVPEPSSMALWIFTAVCTMLLKRR